MITKQSFVMLMKSVQDQMSIDNNTGKIIAELGDREMNGPHFVVTTPMIHTVITALQIEMNDNKNNWSDISYFIYDLEFGRKASQQVITRKDGSEVRLFNAHLLYDWLVENA